MTLDIEGDLRDPERRIRWFEDDDLRRGYIDVIRRQGIKVTGFVVTSILDRYGDPLKRFRDEIPIEYESHSHYHNIGNCASQGEIEETKRAFRRCFGHDPQGFRAPNGLIDSAGVQNLIAGGFKYDTSISPTFRFDEYGYTNLHIPTRPFRIVTDQHQHLIEFPIASLEQVRLMFSHSYVKLLGLGIYRTLARFFPLPDVVVTYAHPYEFYIQLIAQFSHGWKRYAHLRNGRQSLALYERTLVFLKRQGYQFMFMSELYDVMQSRTIPERSIQSL